MRQFRVPTPNATWMLVCKGPVAPAARDAVAAYRAFDTVMQKLPALDAELGQEGWSVVWRAGQRFEAGPLVEVYLWIARSQDGARLQEKLAGLMEDAHFIPSRSFRPVSAEPLFRPQVVHLRAGGHSFGPARLGLVEVVEEERDDVDLGIKYRFPAQRCPSCGVVDHPASIIAGFPNEEGLLAVALGEAVLSGCEVNPRSRRNARCRHCEADFRAR